MAEKKERGESATELLHRRHEEETEEEWESERRNVTKENEATH